MPDLQTLAAKYSQMLKSVNDPGAWQQIADALSREKLTDSQFEEVAAKLAKLDAPEPPPGGQVIVIGGPSHRVKFAVGIARNMRAVRPPC